MCQLCSLAGGVSSGFLTREKPVLFISRTSIRSEMTQEQPMVPRDMTPWLCWIPLLSGVPQGLLPNRPLAKSAEKVG